MKKAKKAFGGLLAAATLCIVPVAYATTNALPVNGLKVVSESGSVKDIAGKANWHEEHRHHHHHHHHHRHEWWGKSRTASNADYSAPRM